MTLYFMTFPKIGLFIKKWILGYVGLKKKAKILWSLQADVADVYEMISSVLKWVVIYCDASLFKCSLRYPKFLLSFL